jgi:FkbM family methyltransferase
MRRSVGARRRSARALRLPLALASVTCRPRSWGPFLEVYESTRFDHAFSVSFSQGGEDLALLSLTAGRGAGTYLDIGAHHPSRFSVTRLLYERGWSGVNVDANPSLVNQFCKERPRDKFVSAFVGIGDGAREFFVFDEPALSTGELGSRDKYVKEGNRIKERLQVPVISLNEIIARYFNGGVPDILNIDCEGSDREVLQSGDWERYRPPIVVVEAPGGVDGATRSGPVSLLASRGYKVLWVLPMSTVLVDHRRL